MNTDSFAWALRKLCRRRPFKTFAVELVTGELLRVVHPEAMAIRRNLIYFVEPDEERRYLDATSVCQLFASARNR